MFSLLKGQTRELLQKQLVMCLLSGSTLPSSIIRSNSNTFPHTASGGHIGELDLWNICLVSDTGVQNAKVKLNQKKIARKIAEYFTFISQFVNCCILILEHNLIITKTRLVSAILNFQKLQVLNIIFTNQDV